MAIAKTQHHTPVFSVFIHLSPLGCETGNHLVAVLFMHHKGGLQGDKHFADKVSPGKSPFLDLEF